MKKTTLLFITLIACSTAIYGQTKKDIILQQTKTIDSLNLESSKLINLNIEISNELAEKNKEIDNLEESIRSKEMINSTNTEEISKLKDVIVSKDEEIATLKNAIVLKDDEIASLKNATISENTIIVEFEDPKEIYFEGTVILESMYDGVFYIDVEVNKGKLAGKTESLYFRSGMEDTNYIDYTGNANFDGGGEGEGKKVSGVIIRSIGNFENYETGEDDSKEIYRVKDLNYK